MSDYDSKHLIACEGPKFGDEHLNTLILFKDLKGLSLAKSQITDSGMAKLSQLKELRNLNLSDTGISDIGLKQLQGLEKLRESRCWQNCNRQG